ncbi:MAG: precorrin-2 C(20)-methyltransferase [Sporomusaceae bacterium]|nr:precorrin-2 C(20)-methyltransferase [Sporomusaceae bacterium]
MLGSFYGIGVGPGPVDLLTVRAVELLKQVDVVCVPASGGTINAALTIANNYIAGKTVTEISLPMTRDPEVLETHWQQGAQQICALLRQGKDVAFITIGDAMLFSTYTYLMKKIMELEPTVTIESVPGITSFAASAAHVNIPLAESNERLLIIPALDDPTELENIFQLASNVVLMKVAGRYDAIVAMLDKVNLLDKAVYISKLGYPEQLVTRDLQSLVGKKIDYLSLILVKQGGL